MVDELTIVRGTADDAPALLALFDDAVAWLADRDQTDQWGTEPFSARPTQVERAQEWAAGGGLWLARDGGGEPAGALVVGQAHDYVPRAPRPELYVHVLLTASAWRGRGVGARLIEHAERLAGENAAEQLRVDCWDGVPALPAAYERLGFARTGGFEVDGWPGAILVRPLDPAAPAFADDFDRLDPAVWIPHYLPQWSSRAESAAAYVVADSELALTIPPGHGVWCAGEHEPPIRVSGIQSGVFSGEVGSTVGQQPFRDGVVVRERQETQWGWTPHHGRLEVRARMDITPRSMASVWMVGIEDVPERSGEICIFEVFGETVEPDRSAAAVGMGVHPFRDPALTDEFAAERVAIDVADFHVYAADWREGRVDFLVDGEHVKRLHQAPDYPMQMMVAAFDFPEKDPAGAYAGHAPTLVVDSVRGFA